MSSPPAPIADEPPEAQKLTEYDRLHLKLYLRLLDAERAGATLGDVAPKLLGLDPVAEPERAKRVHTSHLARAKWISEHGYRDLLQDSTSREP